jgi:putative phosphoesterase
MKLAVLSDSLIQTADVVLHCGDLCSPFMIKELAEPLRDVPIHIVWGNNEGDTFTIGKVAQAYSNVTLHGAMAKIRIGDLGIAINHYPWIAEDLAKSGSYDLVCYGHDHQAKDEWVGECLLLNPGELMGMNSPSSFTLVDVGTREIERVVLD